MISHIATYLLSIILYSPLHFPTKNIDIYVHNSSEFHSQSPNSNLFQESNCEAVILRDINRTFTAHEFFKESGGGGQDALFRLSKAYAAHDTEVGYCQGLSYLAATLLLHVGLNDLATFTNRYLSLGKIRVV